jgi:hypothetical protein
MTDRDPFERLSSAYRMEVTEEAKDRHAAAMHAAIVSTPPSPARPRFGLRRRVAALAGVLVIAAPVGMAVAAESTVPGDLLYPVKELTERVRSVVAPELEATHRVQEAEWLFLRRAPMREIDRAVERAESATSLLEDPGVLGPRLDLIRERVLERQEQERHADHEGSAGGEGGEGHQTDRSGEQPHGTRDGDSAGSKGDSGSGPKAPEHITSTTMAAHSGDQGKDQGRDEGKHDGDRSGDDGSSRSAGGDALAPTGGTGDGVVGTDMDGGEMTPSVDAANEGTETGASVTDETHRS